MTVTIYTGDCRDVLRTIDAESVHTCITSPPYFGLRDYGCDGQMGLEDTPEDFVAGMVEVFHEVRRVLRDDGTLWLNIGDSYANGGKWGGSTGGKATKALHGQTGIGRTKIHTGLKPKDMIGIPWMLAFALRADGWYLRQEIIWHKPNPMPESVRDRCTKLHESIFLLSKSQRYYFDGGAIREPAIYGATSTGVGFGHGFDATPKPRQRVPAGWDTGAGSHSDLVGRYTTPTTGSRRNSFSRTTKESTGGSGQKPQHRENREDVDYSGTRNKRSVWTLPTQPFSEAHFATFPVALVEPCVLAGSPAGGIVLDPFGGAGTTGLAAENLGRDSVLIELNPKYSEIAKRRTQQRGLPLGAIA